MPTGVDLPSRTLLSSLFDSIGKIKPATTSASTSRTSIVACTPFSTAAGTLPPPSSNPLRNLPPQSRNLFVTAHCLLPTTFLAALDILEKGLVVRYVLKPEAASDEKEEEKENAGNILKSEKELEADVDTNTQWHDKPLIRTYYIRSSPPAPQNLTIPGPNFTSTAKPGGGPYATSGSKSYVYEVRPHAWNCTCIAFTLAAYQRSTLSHRQQDSDDNDEDEEEEFDNHNHDDKDFSAVEGEDDDGINDPSSIPDLEPLDGGDKGEWMKKRYAWYGGISANGRGTRSKSRNKGSGVPICKHLLAAVLAERCTALFGAYVVEKLATVDEIVEKAVLWE